MSIHKTAKQYEGLHLKLVYIEDEKNDLFNVVNFPSILPRGHSYFLIIGSNKLKKNTQLKVEIIDADGIPVYTEIPNYLESGARVISVFVDENTAYGNAIITIMGQLDVAPENWNNIYNTKWSKSVLINPNKENDSPIRFNIKPTININEIQKFYTHFSPDKFIKKSQTSGQISVKPIKLQTKFSKYEDVRGWEAILSGSTFNSDMSNGILYVANPAYVYPHLGDWSLTPYTASLNRIINDIRINVLAPTVYDNEYEEYKRIEFNNSNYTILYDSIESGSTSILSSSYMELDLNNLSTFSGKVHRIKVYKKSLSTKYNSYNVVGDYLLEPENKLISNTATQQIPIGTFYTIADFDNYWTINNIGTYPTPSYEFNTAYSFNSIRFFGSKEYTIYPNTSMSFDPRVEYHVKLDTSTIISGSESSSLEIYLSGSSFNNNNKNNLGKLIGTIESIHNNHLNNNFIFVPDVIGSGVLSFYIKSGEWYIKNILVQPSNDIGTHPDSTKLYIPINNIKRGESFQFKIEYFNINGQKADVETIIDSPIVFSGSQFFIERDDNLLSGSLTISNVLNRGIEMAGKNSAYVRSIGYDGFYSASQFSQSGFIIYSGSVLPNTGNNYSGVGVELFGSSDKYLRFSTDPSNLEILTDAFFVGNTSTQFISGSGNNIEISSSNFWLQPDGNLIVTGTGSFGAGIIGGWEILADTLRSSNNNMLLSGSGVISSSNFYVSEAGNITASNVYIQGEISSSAGNIGGWIISEDRLYAGTEENITTEDSYMMTSELDDVMNIESTQINLTLSSSGAISSSNFYLSETGNLTASNAYIQGTLSSSLGNIAGWTIDEKSISKDQTSIITSSVYWADYSSRETSVTVPNLSTWNYTNIDPGPGVWYNSEILSLVCDNASGFASSSVISTGTSGAETTFTVNVTIGGTTGKKSKFHVIGSDQSTIIREFGLPIDTGTVSYGFVTTETSIYLKIIGHISANFIIGNTAVTLKKYNPFMELSSNGLYVFNSPTAYIKIGGTTFEVKGSDVEFESLTVKGDITVYGTTYEAATDAAGTTSDTYTIDSDIDGSNVELRYQSSANYLRWNGSTFVFSHAPYFGANRLLTTSDLTDLNDADTLSGISSSQFVRSDTNDFMTGNYQLTGSLYITGSTNITGNLTVTDSFNPYDLTTGYVPYKSSSALVDSVIYTDGTNVEISGSLTLSGSLIPSIDDTYDLGSESYRWQDVYSVSTTTGGLFETGLRTVGIGEQLTGTIVIWKDNKLEPCNKNEDSLVMGVIKNGKNEPIILGAEYILVTGKIKAGDFIVTSNKKGHGKSAKIYLFLNRVFKRNLQGKIIAQALESSTGDSNLIKAMINKI